MGRIDTVSAVCSRSSGTQPVCWTVEQVRTATAAGRPDPVNLIIFVILALTVLVLVATVAFAVAGP